ncbi:7tm 6 domain containing protein, partial [Asbolus verrucosus]
MVVRSNFMFKTYTMYFTFVVTVSLLGIVYIAIDENPDISQLNYTAAYLAQTVSFFSKLLPFIRNGNRIKKCINYFGAPCFQPHKSELKRIIRKCKKICRRNSMAYCIGIAFAAVVWNVKPVFKEGDKLPLDIWLPFDATCHPTVFWITYIFLATGIAKKIFVKEYEECFSWVVFSQFAGSAFAIGFCCLQLSMNSSLRNAIHMSRWYEFDIQSKKALIIIMERSKKPMIITAGGIVDVTLKTFTL